MNMEWMGLWVVVSSQHRQKCCFKNLCAACVQTPLFASSLLLDLLCSLQDPGPTDKLNPTSAKILMTGYCWQPRSLSACQNTPFRAVCSLFLKAGLQGGHFALGKEQIKLRPTAGWDLHSPSDSRPWERSLVWQPIVYGARKPRTWSSLRSTTSSRGTQTLLLGTS